MKEKFKSYKQKESNSESLEGDNFQDNFSDKNLKSTEKITNKTKAVSADKILRNQETKGGSGYFNTLLQAISNKIKSEIPELNSSINNNPNATTPILKVSLNKLSNGFSTSSIHLEVTLDLSITIISNNTQKEYFNLLEKVILLVKDANWDVKNTYDVEQGSIKAKIYNDQNLSTESLIVKTPEDFDNLNNTNSITYPIWQIFWQQKCLLGKEIEEGEFPSPIKVRMDINGDGIFDEEIIIRN